ncbi:MAG: [protein-PII] uridylyltransferase [Halothiobacillus sp. 28-55-5]|nr:MAG: [protein-PII] uridylyltransferase [Halothiobacillus sp. 28-55-5]
MRALFPQPDSNAPMHPALRAFTPIQVSLRARITEHLSHWPHTLQTPGSAAAFLREHSDLIDEFLQSFWPDALKNQPAALVAVGGYGRHEQFPHSDIDLLILLDDHQYDAVIQLMLHQLWDAGLVIGHAVRTLAECRTAGTHDVTVYTNLLDARLITGDAPLFAQLAALVRSDQIVDDWTFFQAKQAEQSQRYQSFGDAGAKIEPNIKESPGGLRDLHTLRWLGNRIGHARNLHAMHEAGLLRDQEWQALTQAEDFISRVRIGLHRVAGRAEERLLLLHQKTLATPFGFSGEHNGNLAVEQFMQQYFRTTIEVERLNQVILQNFAEQLDPAPAAPPQPINARFQLRGHWLETTDTQVFMRAPTAILELFLLLAQHPDVRGTSASTARQLRANLSVIDEGFRKNAQAHQFFMAILQSPQGVYHALKAMNLAGVLAAYIPAFGQIVGLMQFDLFHAYTVDAHTLLVIRNLRRFSQPQCAAEHPMASQIFSRVEHPEVLYLAGLFHDIAKGRGGDHAELGAQDAEHFARLHGLSAAATARLVWLVAQHLLMSFTAQRRDIEDPTIIEEFAQKVGSIARLNDLYLLTVADIRATNPDLWNSWRDALLKRLHQRTEQWFLQGEQSACTIIESTRTAAFTEGQAAGLAAAPLQRWLAQLPDDYFLRTDSAPIVQHAKLALGEPTDPDASARQGVWISDTQDQHATQIIILTNNITGLFARIVAELERHGLNVQSANLTLIPPKLETATPGPLPDRALFEFFILDQQGRARLDAWSLNALRERLTACLSTITAAKTRIQRRVTPQMASLNVATQIECLADERRQRNVIHISTKDRPGLLADITAVLSEQGIVLRHARISTLGERAEDVFYVVDAQGRVIDNPKTCSAVESALRTAIQSRA